MREYIAFTKKEFLEQLRTYRWLIIFSVFFIMGIISPLLAKMMPDIFAGVKMEGMEIKIPEPTVLDAYTQYFKNFTQMGILVVLLVFGSTISNELMRGTLINILAKGLPRHTVILSKYTAAAALWTAGYLLSAVTDYGYTVYLFKDASVKNLIFSFFCLWLFGCFVIALIFLSSTLASGNFGGLIVSAAALVIMMIGNAFPGVDKFNPVTLASKNMALLNGTLETKGVLSPILISCSLTVLCVYGSILLFKTKKL